VVRKTMFAPARSAVVARIIRISSPEAARSSVAELNQRFMRTNRRDVKVELIRAASLAANRAFASTKRRDLSPRERRELTQVAAIYKKWVDRVKFSR